MVEPFEAMLTGGHPNSLGRTAEVVEAVMADPGRFDELFDCYGSADDVVRLRVSSAMKRLTGTRRELILGALDRLIRDIGILDQASAQWTLAQIFGWLEADMTAEQKSAALKIMQRNLAGHRDWIVLNHTMETLAGWAAHDRALGEWLRPHLERLSKDSRKSVSRRALRKLAEMRD